MATQKTEGTNQLTGQITLDDHMRGCWYSIGSAEGLDSDAAVLNFLVSL